MYTNLECVSRLLQAGASQKKRCNKGWTPRHHAEEELKKTDRPGLREIIELLEKYAPAHASVSTSHRYTHE